MPNWYNLWNSRFKRKSQQFTNIRIEKFTLKENISISQGAGRCRVPPKELYQPIPLSRTRLRIWEISVPVYITIGAIVLSYIRDDISVWIRSQYYLFETRLPYTALWFVVRRCEQSVFIVQTKWNNKISTRSLIKGSHWHLKPAFDRLIICHIYSY